MRIDTIYISANSFVYDLRVTASLLEDSSTALYPAEQVDTARAIVLSMIRRIENASEVLIVSEASAAPEARLGQDRERRDSDGGRGAGAGVSGAL